MKSINENPERRPLIRAAGNPQPYPVDVLPDILKNSVYSLEHAIQSPLALCAQTVLSVVSLSTQGFADIYVDGRVYPISQFFLTVAGSGERKSTTDKNALIACNEYQLIMMQKYSDEQKEYEIKKTAWVSARKNILKKNENKQDIEAKLRKLGHEPSPPLSQIFLIEEFTTEGLFKHMKECRPSMGAFTDEGGRLLGGYSMKTENKTKMFATMNNLWDGKSVSKSTSGGGTELLVGKRLAIHIMVQTRTAHDLLSDVTADDLGFLARCLIVEPQSTIGTRIYKDVDPLKDPNLQLFHQRAQVLLEAPLPIVKGTKSSLATRQIELSVSAKKIYVDYANKIERQMGKNGPLEHVQAYGCKTAEHALRLAGGIALFENLVINEISSQYMEAGIALADFYLNEYIRLQQIGVDNPDLESAVKVGDWLHNNWLPSHGKYIDLASIYQRGPSSVRTAKKARKSIEILEAHGWVVRVPQGSINGKHKKYVWKIL